MAFTYWLVRRIFERVLEAIVVVLMALLATLVIVAFFLRYGGYPLFFYDELASVLLAWLTYYASALAAVRGGHIAFPGLVNAMPPAFRIPVVIFGEIFVIGFFIVLAVMGLRVQEMMAGDSLITLRWFPLTVAQHVIPVGAVLFILGELLRLPELLRFATRSNAVLADKH